MQPDKQEPPTHITDAPARGKTRDWKRWAVPVATLVVGISIGAAGASADPTQSEEYRAQAEKHHDLEQELAAAKDRITAMSERAGAVQADAEEAIREAAEREAELDGQAAELDKWAAELESREQAATAAPPAPAPAPAPRPRSPAAEAGSGGSVAQSNALGKARDYLKFTSFSRSGLIEQLQYEGFSTGDATWAVDNLTVDWNEQAAKKAEEYLSFTSFSRSGLIEQLTYEGFSPQQAEHGARAVGL
ncbi:Ltp family lipoprotein [Blastococcus capsensis]|uniref:Ltp family lipoprotein n=1 Tax=Blastococcus capsensis TaxID=1564163 RepID=UPI00253F6850|nr:Ltp family lipoprotein [Blastococcus capsensis]MDK3255078.1 Ltp family lipoprotein [Blastococcus capsensis]